jgi:hypothetical protein
VQLHAQVQEAFDYLHLLRQSRSGNFEGNSAPDGISGLERVSDGCLPGPEKEKPKSEKKML